MENYECGGLIFNSNFDSGNLGRVELVQKNNEIKPENYLLKEFKLWTKPDCTGTIYENGNRTWFFFGVRGGEIFQTIKFNLMNLNKQAKLYSQGMFPVMRVENGKWERIKDKPTYYIENENFVLSFNHRILDNPDITVYYAFTYPYTYSELQDNLERLDKRFIKNSNDIKCLINKSINESKIKDEELMKKNFELSKKIKDEKNDEKNLNENLNNITSSSILIKEDHENIINSEPIVELSVQGTSQQQQQNSSVDIYTTNEIYYHRELLIHSVEGRRIDLLTISSFHGIQDEREERLINLFPDSDCLRCHTFKYKKIIFISSRVHPGETPASFVLNGFLNFLLDRKSLIAATLRKLYVFKIVPFLNPDGVFNGYYRSDTFGLNLNRIYLNPKLDTQPSIYAARKMIRFYHHGYDKIETHQSDVPTSLNELIENMISAEVLKNLKENVDNSTPRNHNSDSEQNSFKECLSSSCDDTKSYPDKITSTIFTDKLIPEIKPIIGIKKSDTIILNEKIQIKSKDTLTALKSDKFNQNLSEPRSKSANVRSTKLCTKKGIPKKDLKTRSRSPIIGLRPGRGKITNINNIADTVNFTENDKIQFTDDKSNIFLYIDLHGHASKKGVFMYGNHLPNTAEAVECMLLPRLMSMNCHHFSFDACNFSERNMYLKGKKDGLSKEGSGRVSVYKTIGLIKSYTLESNYNTGKCVNILPPKGKETNVKIINSIPPKYTPNIFEEVGRALGPSILDLTNSNPLSRLNNSEFRTLQGLRNSLKIDVDKSIARSIITSKIIRPKLRRMKSNYSSTNSTQLDVLKENNKTYYDWGEISVGGLGTNISLPSTSPRPTTSSSTSLILTTTTPVTTGTITTTATTTKTLTTNNKTNINMKKLQNKNQTIFGKKENSTMIIKKLKVLCEASSSSSSSSLSSSSSSSSGILPPTTKITTIIVKGEQQQQQIQVPRKRIKVSSASSQQQIPITEQETLITSMAKLETIENFNEITNLNKIYIDPPTFGQTSFFQSTNNELSFVDTKKIKSDNTNKLFEFIEPNKDQQNLTEQSACCSLTLKPSTSTATQTRIKTLTRSTKNKFGKSTSTGNLVKKLSEVSKLKKKRILKTETNLKRKKNRVKTVWH